MATIEEAENTQEWILLDRDVYAMWCGVKDSQSFTSHNQTAAFLLFRYLSQDGEKNLSSACSQCSTQLSWNCSRCLATNTQHNSGRLQVSAASQLMKSGTTNNDHSVKRPRGRPRKIVPQQAVKREQEASCYTTSGKSVNETSELKPVATRGRGRPRKTVATVQDSSSVPQLPMPVVVAVEGSSSFGVTTDDGSQSFDVTTEDDSQSFDVTTVKDSPSVNDASIKDSLSFDATTVKDSQSFHATTLDISQSVDAATVDNSQSFDAIDTEDEDGDVPINEQSLSMEDDNADSLTEREDLMTVTTDRGMQIQISIAGNIDTLHKGLYKKRTAQQEVGEGPNSHRKAVQEKEKGSYKKRKKDPHQQGEKEPTRRKKRIKQKNYCCDCDKTFDRDYWFEVHKRVFHGRAKGWEGAVQCDLCLTFFTTETIVKHKMERHNASPENKLYQCTDCQESYTRLVDYERHRLIHTGGEKFYCKICNNMYPSLLLLRRHEKTTKGHSWFSCDICQKKYASKHYLAQHRQTHTMEGNAGHVCNYCGKTYELPQHLRNHVRFVHEEKRYRCDVCDRGYAFLSGLKEHQKTHTKAKPHICHLCGKGCRNHACLAIHLVTHSDQRSFVCDVDQCQAAFKNYSTLAVHKKHVHLKCKPHKCPQCSSAFTSRGGLERHLMIHTGEKPFGCVHCGKRFNRNFHLTQHIKAMHSDK